MKMDTYWLSETPNLPGSRYPGQSIARNHIDLSDKAGALDSEDVGAVTVNNLNIT